MDILQINEIYLTILKYLDIDSIWSLLNINIFSNNKITEYYENNDIIFYDMPLFRSCNNISKYLTHYKSFNSGTNFPDEPLWLFNNKNNGYFTEIDNKYIKSENIRFERPKFFNYFTPYVFLKFEKAFIHWKRLNNQQKYLIWCAIKGFHPELLLNKTLISEDMATLLSEIYWHYTNNFVRQYLEIYCIDTCDLINSKCIASTEIKSELEHYRGSHFLFGYNIVHDKQAYYTNYFNLCGFKENEGHREGHFRFALLHIIKNGHPNIIKSFVNLKVTSDILEEKISVLNKMIDEIDDFEITHTYNLKTTNINYLDHMSINYPNSNYKSKNLPINLDNPDLKDVTNLANIINEGCKQQ
jgi:hypothetical protein